MDPVSGFLADVNEILLGGRTFNGQKVGMDGEYQVSIKFVTLLWTIIPYLF